jgi:two-component system, OmpR family, phosphate regulon response regulator PhoB
MQPQILLVEDDPGLVELLSYNLERSAFGVRVATDGETALLMVKEAKPDLMLLDWMLPGVSGLEVCRRLRRGDSTAMLPILILTARGEEADRVRGLDTGADDFMTKPFSVAELVARIKALLRRARPGFSAERLDFSDLRMDLVSHRVMRSGRPVHLGPTEWRLLRHLMENPGRVFSREQLLDAVWGHDVAIELRTVDAHIRRLRAAIVGPGEPDPIRTVRNAGYALGG